MRHLRGDPHPHRCLERCSSPLVVPQSSIITKQPHRHGQSAHQLPSPSEQPFLQWHEGLAWKRSGVLLGQAIWAQKMSV